MEQEIFTYQSLLAYTVLLRNLSPQEQQSIRTYRSYGNSAELAWHHLKCLYQANDSVTQSRLMQQLTTIQMKTGEKAMQYMSRCQTLRDRLLRCGGTITEESFVTLVLAGLGPEWRTTRSLLRAHGRISEMHLCAELHAEQQEMDLFEERQPRKQQQLVFYTQRRNDNNYNRRSKQDQRDNRGLTIVPPFCHNCQTSGHSKVNCNRPRVYRAADPQVASTQASPSRRSSTSAQQTPNIINCMVHIDNCAPVTASGTPTPYLQQREHEH
ncbi:hypothetical protein CLOM_g8912 [Closterium sp. NIES-68]|nr:hypothetical protein CLOM_g8912 [Closterium sp. NIES-68]